MVVAVTRLVTSTHRRITVSRNLSAATPPTSTKTTIPTAPAAVTRDRSTADPPSSMTRATMATAHSPDPNTLTPMARASTV